VLVEVAIISCLLNSAAGEFRSGSCESADDNKAVGRLLFDYSCHFLTFYATSHAHLPIEPVWVYEDSNEFGLKGARQRKP
jgi:hypothetical protein